jgi:hypothetical protein
MNALFWILAAVAWCFALHGATRSSTVWAEADRSRGFWVTLLVVFNALLLIPYLVGVFPRIVGAERQAAQNPFSKRARR